MEGGLKGRVDSGGTIGRETNLMCISHSLPFLIYSPLVSYLMYLRTLPLSEGFQEGDEGPDLMIIVFSR